MSWPRGRTRSRPAHERTAISQTCRTHEFVERVRPVRLDLWQDPRYYQKTVAGIRAAHSPLCWADIHAIRAAHRGGQSAASLAQQYGVRPNTISYIVRGWTWREDDPREGPAAIPAVLPPQASRYLGYFSGPDQTRPAYDPGPTAPCPLCGQMLAPDPVRTISLLPPEGNLSLFYRVHRSCHNPLGALERTALDERLLRLCRAHGA